MRFSNGTLRGWMACAVVAALALVTAWSPALASGEDAKAKDDDKKNEQQSDPKAEQSPAQTSPAPVPANAPAPDERVLCQAQGYRQTQGAVPDLRTDQRT